MSEIININSDSLNGVLTKDESDVSMTNYEQLSLPWEDVAEMDEQKRHMEDDTPPDFSDLEHQ